MFGRFVRVTLTQLRIFEPGVGASCTCRAKNFYSLFSFNQNPSALESRRTRVRLLFFWLTDGPFFFFFSFVLQHARLKQRAGEMRTDTEATVEK